ncbi:hypothetical protein V8C42DRAFT_356154 [Trichoderma barbatum]
MHLQPGLLPQLAFPAAPSHSATRPMPHRQPEISLGFANMSETRHFHNRHSSETTTAQQRQAYQDGASDPTISRILDSALSHIWDKVQAQPDLYIVTRDEFAVFNFFQHRFIGDRMAITARKRYWHYTKA